MKKLLMVILTVAVAICTLGLTACGDDNSGETQPPAHEHVFTNYVSDNNATCSQDGTKTATCTCGETNTVTDVDSKLEHVFTNYVSDNNATYEADGTKTATCDRVGCNAKDSVTDIGTKLDSTIAFKTLTVTYNTVSGSVANDVTSFSFENEIEIKGNVTYIVSKNANGTQTTNKTVTLKEGNNVFYLIVDKGNNDYTTYIVTLRRTPSFTVSFNTNGGSSVSSQRIVEGEKATMPTTTPTKLGYTFDGWNFDFNTPITANKTINAKWVANTYELSFDGNGGENPEKTTVTYDSKYGTLPTPTRTGYSFKGWTTEKDGSSYVYGSTTVKTTSDQTLYAKWQINEYRLVVEKSHYVATISSGTYYDYNSQVTLTVKDIKLGYEFLGWYNGDTELSKDLTYVFNMPANALTVTAKFKVADEMANFNFSSTTTTCEITALKDKTLTEITIPNCVTSIGSSAFYGCSGLTSITIPNSVTSIDYQAFYDCDNLKTVTFGENSKLESIGSYAFYDCDSLESIEIPSSVTSIGTYACYRCYKLVEAINKSSLTITKGSLNYGGIGYYALQILTEEPQTSNFIEKDSYTFYNANGEYYLISYNGSETELTLPENINGNDYAINQRAFYGNDLITSVEIPSSATSIGSSAFSSCYNLTSIER